MTPRAATKNTRKTQGEGGRLETNIAHVPQQPIDATQRNASARRRYVGGATSVRRCLEARAPFPLTTAEEKQRIAYSTEVVFFVPYGRHRRCGVRVVGGSGPTPRAINVWFDCMNNRGSRVTQNTPLQTLFPPPPRQPQGN